MSERHTVYFGLGTNLGDRQRNLAAAIRQMGERVQFEQLSSLYETEPAYVTEQPRFLNMAARGTTELAPHELLAFLKQVERQVGRVPTVRYGPRLIDIDILLYDDLVLDTPELTIPHRLIAERGFVLRPLAEIAPDLLHPVLNKTISRLAARLPVEDGVLHVIGGLAISPDQSG
jgi:2-amino-4-hydroxy-6-hydroxymethyldihydropteridine diphosphokinase